MIGAAALLLSSKYHDVKHINMGFLVRLCDGAFKKDDLLNCESKMLCNFSSKKQKINRKIMSTYVSKKL